MKKILVFFTMFVFLITQRPLEANAVKALKVTVNGQVLILSVPPTVEGNEVLLPAKELINALGGTYSWINASKFLAIKK